QGTGAPSLPITRPVTTPAALAATGEPLVLVDVRGDVITTLPALGADRTHWTELGTIPAIAVSAVIESEDQGFWRHRGIDGVGIARAVWLNLKGGRYGGSTLTMQLARMMVSPGKARTVGAKAREMLVALRLERSVDKRTILEQWMNRAYFGNGAYGFDAAARLYFDKPASALSDGEAIALAVIPRAPTSYDPLKHPGALERRRDHVLELLVAHGTLTAEAAHAARTTPIAFGRHLPENHAPHFTAFVADHVPAKVRAAGGRVQTTLDLQLQRVLQRRTSEQVAALRHLHVQQAGVVVLDTESSEIRAMVGSTGWSDPGGQLNLTTRRRHPGSALKPFVYATSIERGASPATIAWDIRDASDKYRAPHTPEHGPVRYREALASSYNFAAVDVLEQVGVERVMTALRTAGVAGLDGSPDDYGLRLALGAPKVRLLDLAASYGFVVKSGSVGTPRPIAYVTLPDGSRWTPRRAPERRVFSPATSWMVMDRLADPEARRPGFGMELPLDLPFPIAAKTGTARGFADTWAIGATREVIVGAWVGAIDGAPTQGIVAMDAAAPLVRDAMLAVANGRQLTLAPRPSEVQSIEVCATSGMLPSEYCPRIRDYAHRGRAPTQRDTWHDGITGVVRYPARANGWLVRTRDRALVRR
ncbi:MAG: transglycosylase domain-containing protein, partial [Kofleriaceae bacterium]